jgi:hypothetical protein
MTEFGNMDALRLLVSGLPNGCPVCQGLLITPPDGYECTEEAGTEIAQFPSPNKVCSGCGRGYIVSNLGWVQNCGPTKSPE